MYDDQRGGRLNSGQIVIFKFQFFRMVTDQGMGSCKLDLMKTR